MTRSKKGGPISRGLSEDKQLVRGPSTLLDAMRERAKAEGKGVAEIWREAASQWLGRVQSLELSEPELAEMAALNEHPPLPNATLKAASKRHHDD